MDKEEAPTVNEHGERVRKVLRGCAEQVVPDTMDLWPGIWEGISMLKRRRSRGRNPEDAQDADFGGTANSHRH